LALLGADGLPVWVISVISSDKSPNHQNCDILSNFTSRFGSMLMNRRNFLKLCGLAASGLTFGISSTGCAPYSKNVNWKEVPDSEFSIQKFDEWFVFHKLYNGINPNLGIGKTGLWPTFSQSIRAGVTPGMDYNSNSMYAVADGVVSNMGKITGTGRLEGNYVQISHPLSKNAQYGLFTSSYNHLGKIHVTYEKVKRGDLIATVEYTNHAKLFLRKGVNVVDPDNYGINHSYMSLWDGKAKLDVADMETKSQNQRQIVTTIAGYLSPTLNINFSTLAYREHRPYKEQKRCRWDDVEIMRYLDELYQARPQLFTKLTPEKFAEYKSEFYANQPIILTLPLKA
jgi:hypothetical protein